MSLKKLSNREMVQLGSELIDPGQEPRKAIDRIPAALGMIPVVAAANEALVAAQPPSGSELEALTDAITAKDLRHDDVVRSIDARMESEQYATQSEETRQRIAHVRSTVLPTGRAVVQASHLEQAGEVKLREGRVGDDHRELMRKLETLEGESMEGLLDELQEVGTELGELHKQREALGAAGDVVIKNGEARYQWMRAINALEAVLVSVGVDPEAILGAVYEAEQAAEQRDATDADPTDTDVTGGDPTDGPPPDLDPPVPNDGGPTGA